MELRRKLHGQIKEFIVKVGWTHKIHIVESDRQKLYALIFKVAKIIVSGIATCGALGIIFTEQSFEWKLGSAILAFATFALTGLDREIGFEKVAIKEKIDAEKLWVLKDQAVNLLFDLKYQTKDVSAIEKEFDNLLHRRRNLYGELLSPSQFSVHEASKLIKNRKDNDYSEDYGYFVPKELLTFEVQEDEKQ